ncbi:MAG: hypothetical protein HPY50_13635 [Firmicutes bacterium]|nr:hypothetical protein [Bacillota bacterium]
MAGLSLRSYLERQGIVPGQGLRGYCAPGLNPIGLRSLISAPRIIHISDLHFVDSDHTWIWESGVLTQVKEDSGKKSREILGFLLSNREKLGTNVVVITGDLTDRGGEGDYRIAVDFIRELRENGFEVHSIPGNHDYCWLGNIIFEDIFRAARAIDVAEIRGKASIQSQQAVEAAVLAKIEDEFNTRLAAGIPGYRFPRGVLTDLLQLFSVISSSVVGNTDTVDNQQRRQRFIRFINPDTSNAYPRVVPLANGYLVMLDSMQAELDEETGDHFAQGKIGTPQLQALKVWLLENQAEREAGKKVIVCVHHSPFHLRELVVPDGFSVGRAPDEFTLDFTCGLDDALDFLEVIKNRVDCLLFGHVTPAGLLQLGGGEKGYFSGMEIKLGVPLINCENLLRMSERYPVTILDLGTYQRLVYLTDGTRVDLSWGHPTARSPG